MNIQKNNYIEHFKQAESHFIGRELPWLKDLRLKRLDDFMHLGLPSRREEHWKYTDLTCLHQMFSAGITPAAVTSSSAVIPAPPVIPSEARDLRNMAKNKVPGYTLVFIDGHFSKELSSIEDLEEKISLAPLSEMLNTQPDIVRPYLEQKTNIESQRFIDFNTAFISDGFFLRVPKNTILKKPIHLLSLASSQCCPRNIIVLEENSEAIILEEHRSLDGSAYYKNSVTQIDLKHNASLNYYKLQNENDAAFHIATTRIHQARDSKLHHCSLSLGGKLARDDLNIAINESGAFCQLYGLYLLAGRQQVDHHTRIDHFSPHSISEEYYKGILSGEATGVFNGKVIVHPHAQKTKSQQTNKNLLLSNAAEMNTKPEFEIYADDVQCTHGATVGQIAEESLFYLRSRGLDKHRAVLLLVQAFATEILQSIKHSEIAEYLNEAVMHRLATLTVDSL